jgi:2-polyprenyl-3-methyl-5-hydroxy-6-metoxy-1,4-benzoquinol methylase
MHLEAYLGKQDALFHERANSFFLRYKSFIESESSNLDFGVDCFNKLRASMAAERLAFLRTGQYASKSFEEVSRRVYDDPDVMRYHMHGLVFAQFFWPEQYCRLRFFLKQLLQYKPQIRSYLEVGGGHALYITEAMRALSPETKFDLVDVSPSSMALARGIIGGQRVQYHLMNMLDFPSGTKFDFIMVGEVLEHLERPQELLTVIHDLLSAGGRAVLTTPANSATLDHIYLFNDADEIREMLRNASFVIEDEVMKYSVDMSERRARLLKTPLMYGALVRLA